MPSDSSNTSECNSSIVKDVCSHCQVFIFSNQAEINMLETTRVPLQDISLDKMLDDDGGKVLIQ
ncbi:homeobox-leucine zipper protein ATHB-15 [Artemisia annua]|uniref:Homeobox-leucine zipper protein ATHB-15 n=1 Tax=Artemisia annua TaxID=35608 RepID=A0A2U1KBL0_ARTAN|nr:homeobox-leucine zipper protein ATHB-15 [Artemisia annua]